MGPSGGIFFWGGGVSGHQYACLSVILVVDVDSVDFHDAVALSEPGGLGRAARVHFAHELAGARFLRV